MSVFPAGAFGDRVRTRLRDAYAIWLTTVGDDGTPQPNPVWFIWGGGDSIVVYNRPDAHRLAHIEARPRISLHLDGDGRGGDIVVLAGTAEPEPALPPPNENPDYVAKYAEGMVRVSGSQERFAADYGVPLRITIRRIRGY